jgi:hypothetical protein
MVMMYQRQGRKVVRYAVPYAVGLGAWLAAWLTWRALYPSNYPGSMLKLDAWASLKTIIVFSIGGMPFATLPNELGHVTFMQLLARIDAMSLVKASAAFVGMMYLVPHVARSEVLLDRRAVVGIAATLCVLAVLPNAAVALTPQYQEWVKYGVEAYLYSHFSYFAWIALCLLLMVFAARRWPSSAIVVILAMTGAFGSLVTDAANKSVNIRQEYLGARWETMRAFVDSEFFLSMPSGARIWMEDASLQGSAPTDAAYWEYLIRARTARNLTITSTQPDPSSSDNYYLFLYDEPALPNQYVLIAKIEPQAGKWVARDARVIVRTPNPSMRIGGPFACFDSCLGGITVNGIPPEALFQDHFRVAAAHVEDSKGISGVDIQSSAPMDIRALWIDFARNKLFNQAFVKALPANGFADWHVEGAERWSWAVEDATLEVTNFTGRNVPLVVGFFVAAEERGRLEVVDDRGDVLSVSDILPHTRSSLEFEFDAPPGGATVHLRASLIDRKNAVEPKPAYKITTPWLRVRGENRLRRVIFGGDFEQQSR